MLFITSELGLDVSISKMIGVKICIVGFYQKTFYDEEAIYNIYNHKRNYTNNIMNIKCKHVLSIYNLNLVLCANSIYI